MAYHAAAMLRLSGTVSDSIVDGPGIRYTIFTQGCPHACPGCHNPETHDPAGGYAAEIEDILQQIRSNPLLDGVTLSGGEPMAQAEALLPLVKAVRRMGLHIILYSGYTYEQLLKNPVWAEFLQWIDLLIDGPFLLKERSLDLLFRGSRNQRVIDVPASLAQGQVVLYRFEE